MQRSELWSTKSWLLICLFNEYEAPFERTRDIAGVTRYIPMCAMSFGQPPDFIPLDFMSFDKRHLISRYSL